MQVDLPLIPRGASKTSNDGRPRVAATPCTPDERAKASAANLWSILTSKDDTYKETAPCIDNFASKHPQDRLSAPFGMFDIRMGAIGMFDTRMDAIGMPAELESKDVPYVHANSLTGHGNERAEYHERDHEEHRTVICDVPIACTPKDGMYPGLNEMVVDHDIYAEQDDERHYWDA